MERNNACLPFQSLNLMVRVEDEFLEKEFSSVSSLKSFELSHDLMRSDNALLRTEISF